MFWLFDSPIGGNHFLTKVKGIDCTQNQLIKKRALFLWRTAPRKRAPQRGNTSRKAQKSWGLSPSIATICTQRGCAIIPLARSTILIWTLASYGVVTPTDNLFVDSCLVVLYLIRRVTVKTRVDSRLEGK